MGAGGGPVERVGEAALKSYMTGGKVSIPEAMRQIEQQEFTRLYNTATAMTGLARRFGLGETVANARQDSANQRTIMAETMKTLRDISDDYGPDAAVAAQRFLQDNDPDPSGNDPVAARRVLSQVYSEIGRQFPRIGRGRGAAAAAGPSGASSGARGGFDRDEGGEIIGFTPFEPAPSQRLTTDENKLNMAFRNDGLQGVIRTWQAMSERAQRPPGAGSGAAGERELSAFRNQLAAADTTMSLIESIKNSVAQSGAAIMGAAGGLSRFLTGITDQAASLIGMETVRERTANATRSFTNELMVTPQTREAFAWLDRDTSERATALKSNLLILGSVLAKALDPNGRLSNQDVQMAMAMIGQQGTGILDNPSSMVSALNAVEAYLQASIEARRARVPVITRAYPEPIPLGRRRAPTETAVPGGTPAPSSPPAIAPPQEAIDALRAGAGTPEQFDAIFGPGAARRALGR